MKINEIAWGKNIKTKSQKKAESRERLKKRLKSVGSAVGSSVKYMGRSISKIRKSQDSGGASYNVFSDIKGSSTKPKSKIKKKLKQRIIYIYPKRKKRIKYIKIKQKPKKDNERYNPSNPFNLSI